MLVYYYYSWGLWRNIPVHWQTAVHRGRRKMRGSARNRKTAMRTHSRQSSRACGDNKGRDVSVYYKKSNVISLRIGTIDKNKSRSRCAGWAADWRSSVAILHRGRWFVSLLVYRRRFRPRWDWLSSAAACRRNFGGVFFSLSFLKTFKWLRVVTELAESSTNFGLFRPLSLLSRSGSFCSTTEAGKDVKHLQPNRSDVTYSTFDSSGC